LTQLFNLKYKKMTKSDKILIFSSVIVILIIVGFFMIFNKKSTNTGLFHNNDAENGGTGSGDTGTGNIPGGGAGETGGDTASDEAASYYTDLEAKECTGKETKMDDAFFIEYMAQNMYLSEWTMKYTAGQSAAVELSARIKSFKSAVPVFCVNDAAFEEYQNGIIEDPEKFDQLMPKVQARVAEFEQQYGAVE